MIEVRRFGRHGNMLEEDGPNLFVEFYIPQMQMLFRGVRQTWRFMETKRGYLRGWAPEDKFHIFPKDPAPPESGKRNIAIHTDPGGDIYLELSTNAGLGLRGDGRGWPSFPIEEISDNPDGLLERGVDTLVLPNLILIERERLSRERTGFSIIGDDEWEESN